MLKCHRDPSHPGDTSTSRDLPFFRIDVISINSVWANPCCLTFYLDYANIRRGLSLLEVCICQNIVDVNKQYRSRINFIFSKVNDLGMGNMIERFRAQVEQASITTITIMQYIRRPLLNLGKLAQNHHLPAGQANNDRLVIKTLGIREMIFSQG